MSFVNSYSQVLSEPSSSGVYDLLNRLAIKGIIRFNDELKPLSRIELFNKLLEINLNKVSQLELEEIKYYKKEFAPELILLEENSEDLLQFFQFREKTGFRFFLFRDNVFVFNVDPIFGLKAQNRFDEFQTHRWNGLQFYGYINKNWAFNFYFRDNEEKGGRIDKSKWFSNEQGINISQSTSKSFQYVDVRGQISFSWEKGNITLAKEYIEWGSGISGKLILSDKAPSFPFIKLELTPANWLKFVYFHGWLHSALIDSSSVRKTLVYKRDSFSQIEKFIAAHMISIYPTSNLSISVGESIVYSDHLEFLYFVPILFFRAADHYLSRDSSNSGDNAQLFFNAVYKNYDIKTKFYSTLFIDELSITNLLKGRNLSAVGFTLGISIIDPIIENSELNFEYTRLNPFVYMNSNDAQLYTSHNYQLGHWIGSNADQFYAEYNQSFLRGLKLKIFGEYIRKGQRELPEEQYKLPYPSFLYGNQLRMTNLGFKLRYDFFHNLFSELSFIYSNTSDEEIRRIPTYQLGKKYSFGVSLGYGL